MGTRALGNGAILATGLAGLVVFARLFTWAMDTQSYNTWGALFLVPLVVAINLVLLNAAVRREADPWIAHVIIIGFVAKLVAIAARYVMAYYLYGGTADAEGYNLYAIAHYLDWRAGEIWWEPSSKPGTLHTELITTALYVVIGPSVITAFFVFGVLAFWGVYLIHRSFQIALPQGDGRRYALLLFLLPSVLFWPSSIGKEAWLMLFVGVTAYGAARFFTHGIAVGLTWMSVGVLGTALIRPHVTVLMMAAIFVAQLFRPTARRSTSLLSKAGGMIVIGVAGAILVTVSAQYLGIDDLSAQAVADQVDWASGQTVQGGSTFTPVPLASPLGVPAAIVTLLFRPFPWEAANIQMLVQGVEGLLLIVLTLTAWPRLRALPTLMPRNPWLVFAVVYTLGFILAFAGFANFGILARQRVLMIPFFLVMLALPRPLPKAARQPLVREATRRELAGAGRR